MGLANGDDDVSNDNGSQPTNLFTLSTGYSFYKKPFYKQPTTRQPKT